VKDGIRMESFFDYDENHFTYKRLHNYQFMTCNNIIVYQLLTIGMYLNKLIFNFDNILIIDKKFRTLLVVMCNKTMFVTS
jgi:hypothetical protein